MKSLCRATVAALACWSGGVAMAQETPTVDEVLSGIVELSAVVPADARTADTLGTERGGHGIVIDANGLVLTIGYLILEAESVSLTAADGATVPAEIVGYDYGTGLGLVRATGPLAARPVPMADSTESGPGDEVLIAGAGGVENLIAARIVSRRTFAGYWEYMLEDAIFTMPPYPNFGGAALLDKEGRLVAVGSLFVEDAAHPDSFSPGNMFVPVEVLKPILADMLTTGRAAGPRHPWLGLYTQPAGRGLIVSRVAVGGPAAAAGIVAGSMLLGLDGEPIGGQEDFYRRLWAKGEPGVSVTLTLVDPEGEAREIKVITGDRYDWLRLPPAH